ncbi:hypothetical protein QQ045_023279 [Rhodiola kirilowii]
MLQIYGGQRRLSSDQTLRMIAATNPSISAAIASQSTSTSRSCCCPVLPIPIGNLEFRRKCNFGSDSVCGFGGRRRKMEALRRVIGGCFRDGSGSGRGKQVEIESVSGGEEMVDAGKADSNVYPEHLVVMVNGLAGSAADWRYAAEQFVKKLPDKVFVHRSECNYSKKTFDGVDLMGERLADEVLSIVKRRPEVQKISFVAHSLGGLVARYAIGRLYESVPNAKDPGNVYTNHSDQPAKLPNKSKIAGLEPINFITVASPHLGSRGHRQLPLLCGLPFLERSASQTAHWLVGRTGKHLFLTDHDDGKPPLLLRMATDSEDLRFISALQAFKRRVAYANVNYDHVVGWSTSSIRRCNELPKSNLLFLDEKYPHVAYVEGETSKVIQVKTPSTKTDQTTELEEEMIRGLTQVHWDRVDVSFHKSRQRIVAHNTIQVKTFWLNSDGVDVVCHIIDNFLL